MDKRQEANRWNKVTAGSRRPKDGLMVLVVVTKDVKDREVLPAVWNERRKLWFSGERPVYPQHWRPMPRLPKEVG